MSTNRRTNAMALLALAAGWLLGGCNLISAPVAIFAPPKKVAAQFTLDPASRALVLAESSIGQLEQPQFRLLLAEYVADQLYGRSLVDSVVSDSQLRSVSVRLDRRYAPEGRRAPIDVLAAETGADVVIYLDIQTFKLAEHQPYPMWRPSCGLGVRVVGADGRQLWPEGFNSAFPVSAELTPKSGEDRTMAMQMSEQLAASLAEDVAKLFYAHREPRF